MFVVTNTGGHELRQEFHVIVIGDAIFTLDGVRDLPGFLL